MTTHAKLTDTQTTILKAAANRQDGNIEPFPPTLRGGARAKVIEGLLARGLIIDIDGQHQITDAGYTAVGKQRPVPKGVQKMDAPDALTKREPTSCCFRRRKHRYAPTRRASHVVGFLHPDRNISLAVQHTPDINAVWTLKVKHEVRIARQRPGAQPRQVEFVGVAG